LEVIIDAKTDPTATTNTKSKTLSLESVRFHDTRSIPISAAKPTIVRVTVLPMLYQLSKKKGGCGIAGYDMVDFTRTRWGRMGTIAGIAPLS